MFLLQYYKNKTDKEKQNYKTTTLHYYKTDKEKETTKLHNKKLMMIK